MICRHVESSTYLLSSCHFYSIHPCVHRFKSLDDIFYFGGQTEHQHEAIYSHKPARHNQVRQSPHPCPDKMHLLAVVVWDGGKTSDVHNFQFYLPYFN